MGTPRYLIDTHLLYWWLTGSAKLGPAATDRLQRELIVVSTVSLWEMVLKNRKGKLPLPDESLHEAVSGQGFELIPITSGQIEALRGLDVAHEDPFDRLLLATASAEQCTFLTRDRPILALGLPYVDAA